MNWELGIAKAKYEPNKNAVREDGIFTADNYEDLEKQFIKLHLEDESMPICMYYFDDYTAKILVTTPAYKAEYKKVID